jgi:hypothetical protein
MSEGFQHAIAGGQGKLVIDQLQSPNFQLSPLTGWAVLKNGEAYFADVIVSGSFEGNDFLVTTVGVFFYNGTPALGNLAFSFVPGAAAITDPEGNTAQPGITSYGSSTAYGQLLQGLLSFTGIANPVVSAAGEITLSSGSDGGGDSPAEVQLKSANANSGIRLVILLGDQAQIPQTLFSTGDVTINQNFIISDNLTVDGTLTVGGSPDTSSNGLPNGGTQGTSSSAGLTDGTIHGTSGSQSTGAAHTHGPGSFAVGNGQHTHGPGSYSVTNGVHAHTL